MLTGILFLQTLSMRRTNALKKKRNGKPFPALFDESYFIEAEIESSHNRAIFTPRDLVARVEFLISKQICFTFQSNKK